MFPRDSRDCDTPHLDLWARQKGIGLLGTGDFTHAAWRAELREALAPAGEGVYALREALQLPCLTPGVPAPRFVVSGEISTIYKKKGKTRKVHSLILLPGLDEAEALAHKLEAIGNLHADGRPILGLDCRDLLELTLDTCPDAVFIPAHIWTPHFSLFGAFSGFDTLEDCFEDLSPHIHALETGLSSDPPMNWQVSALDRYTLVSNSDAHSPARLAREANLLDTAATYPALAHALRTGDGFAGTLEFFPEEGKYHLDGHRTCHQRMEPAQARELGGNCPVCGRPVTIGVQHRVEELADRPAGFRPKRARPFESLAPLEEVLSAAIGSSAVSKKVRAAYEHLLRTLGPELYILREASLEDISHAVGALAAEAVRRLRCGEVERLAGYDGEYGTISLFRPGEREALVGQLSLFGAEDTPPTCKCSTTPLPAAKHTVDAAVPAHTLALNAEQQQAVESDATALAVIAGPGTGKTKTLVARIAHLIRDCGTKPGEITAVTFTNQAADELRARLEAELGGKAAVRGLTAGTFHAVCLKLLDSRPLLSENEAMALLCGQLPAGADARTVLRSISRVKSGASCAQAGVDPAVYEAYCARLCALGVRDLDDVLLDALKVDVRRKRMFTHLLVDEFQDVNAVQRRLVAHWAAQARSLFVIGDPDQSIYGFRGADASCFDALQDAFPALRTISLTQNYRSTPQILQCAREVIRHNPGPPRTLLANVPEGVSVRLVSAQSSFAEAVWIAQEIGRMAGGVDMLSAQHSAQRAAHAFSDVAVLCRTRRQLELIEHCLRHDDIPCVVSGREEYLGDGAVCGALNFFRWLLDPRHIPALRASLQLVWDCPADLLERAAVCCTQMAGLDLPALRSELGEFSPLEPWLRAAETFWPRLHREPPRKLLGDWIAAQGGNASIEKLLNASVFHNTLAGFLQALLLGQEADVRRMSGKRIASGAVRLMTLHGAKGLEFPVVFLAGLTEGMLPLVRERDPIDPAEERRLFFVGVTRAREELILTGTQPLSPFADELPSEVSRSAARSRSPRAEQLSLF